MGKNSGVPYCDSSLNLQMGCDGCELWNVRRRTCYAGRNTQKYSGNSGWPTNFEEPVIYGERINLINKWPDLTGTERRYRPWLNGLPRIIFLNDEGDTFTESLPLTWLQSFMMPLTLSQHIYIILTKRARRMHDFFFNHALTVPPNFWIGVSVTTQATVKRVEIMHELMADMYHHYAVPNITAIVSAEPAVEPLDIPLIMRHEHAPDTKIAWLLVGGESDDDDAKPSMARPIPLDWVRSQIAVAGEVGTKVFVKQLGSVWARQTGNFGKGEDFYKWPHELRVREVPTYETNR